MLRHGKYKSSPVYLRRRICSGDCLRVRTGLAALAAIVSAALCLDARTASACIRLVDAGVGCAGCQSNVCLLCVAGDCAGTRVVCERQVQVLVNQLSGDQALESVLKPCWKQWLCEKMDPEGACDDAGNPCIGGFTFISQSDTYFASVIPSGQCSFPN